MVLRSLLGCADEHEPRDGADEIAREDAASAERADASPSTRDERDASSSGGDLDASGARDASGNAPPGHDAGARDLDANSAQAASTDAGDASRADAAPRDAEPLDAARHDARPLAPACTDCAYSACASPTALFRIVVFARPPAADRCYRLSFAYLGGPTAGFPYEVSLGPGWVAEPALFGDDPMRCKSRASDWLGTGATGALVSHYRGQLQVDATDIREPGFAQRISGDLSLEFEGDAGQHAVRLRFEDLAVNYQTCSAP